MDDTKASIDSIDSFKKGREFVERPKRQDTRNKTQSVQTP